MTAAAALSCVLPPATATASDADAAVERVLHPRWRGINAHVRSVNEPFHDVLDYAASHGANAIRITFEPDSADPGLKARTPASTLQNPLAPYERNLALLDSFLPVCRQLDVQVILATADHHGNPNDFWRAISNRYKEDPIIVAYEIKNHPDTIAAIRSRDKNVWLVIASAPPSGGKDVLRSVNDPRVIHTWPGEPLRFDGNTQTFFWDNTAVKKTLEDVTRFQQRNPGVRILVGEFGVRRDAPGGAQWLADSIGIFERHGWDWTFDSIGESPDRDPTYTANEEGKKRPSFKKGLQETDRLKVLKTGWARNAAQN
jgi:hypothetical protein